MDGAHGHPWLLYKPASGDAAASSAAEARLMPSFFWPVGRQNSFLGPSGLKTVFAGDSTFCGLTPSEGVAATGWLVIGALI